MVFFTPVLRSFEHHSVQYNLYSFDIRATVRFPRSMQMVAGPATICIETGDALLMGFQVHEMH